MAILEPKPGVPQGTQPVDQPGLAGRLNWLRAGVLGANDGVVSTAALVIGVAGATTSRGAILLAGLIGLLAGAMSMAAGEYVSVSTQRDSERAVLARQRRRLATHPAAEVQALAAAYGAKGIDPEVARQVAEQLTAHDALAAHAEARFGIDADELTNPWHAAYASFIAFSIGALVPLAGFALDTTIWTTVAVVVLALAGTGAASARLGDAPLPRAIARNVGGGLAAMAVTYALGSLVGMAL
jgi:VIT1/CCC1 family predicted Fe2+/Mn2+ transporter